MKLLQRIIILTLVGLFFSIPIAHAQLLPDDGRKDTGSYGVNQMIQTALNISNQIMALSGSIALIVIIYGGFMMTLAGVDSKNAQTGKSAVRGASIGLVIIFIAYTAVNFIFSTAGVPAWSVAKKGPEKPIQTTAISKVLTDTCSDCYNSSTAVIDYNKITKTEKIPDACGSLPFSSYGANANILKSIAATESKCNTSIPNSSKGACGIMQILPATAKEYPPVGVSADNIDCTYLREHPDKSIEIANNYINKNASAHKSDPNDIAAGYNSGYGTKPNGEGLLPALAPSVTCSSIPGTQAYECAKDPGGLAQTQAYVTTFRTYYNNFK